MKDSLGRENRKLVNRKCAACRRDFRPVRESAKYCSKPCLWSKNGGKNKKAESWWKNSKGYIEGRIWLPDGSQVRFKQHRFVMEGILGRPLLPSEDVHHKDGDKANNAPENLEVISHGEHSKITNLSREYKRGYSLNLSKGERKRRSLAAISRQLSAMGRAAIAMGIK